MTLTHKSRLAPFHRDLASCCSPQVARSGLTSRSLLAPNVPGYTPAPLSTTSSTANVAGGEAQQFVDGRDIPGEWWTLFHSTAAQRFDRALAQSQSRPQSGASGIVGCKRKCAGSTRRLLSECHGRFFGDASEVIELTFHP